MKNMRAHFLYYLTAAIAAFGIIFICVSFFSSLSPAADNPLKQAIEFDLSTLEEGEHIKLDIYGDVIYIRHRTPEDIKAVRVAQASSPDLERDADRLLSFKGKKDPRYIIVRANSSPWCFATPSFGDFEDQGGWYCISRGTHFDGSGRARKGPDMDLKVPRNARLISKTTVQFLNTP